MKTRNVRPHHVVMTLVLFIAVVSVLGREGVLLAQSNANAGIVEQIGDKGEVDWTNGVIRATGFGAPPDNAVNKRLSVRMAKRAARVVAYRNLLEIVEGIRIDSRTQVKNYMVEEDTIDTKVRGIIKGAQVVKEQEFPDGSVEVMVEMRLNVFMGNEVIPTPTAEPKPIPPKPDVSPPDNTIYTGLVVNAQGVPVETALRPRLLVDDGSVVYGPEWVDDKIAERNGLVGWMQDVEAARMHERVTSRPLTVTALRASGADIIISDADAQTLHAVPEHMEFMKQGKVLIVLDQ